MDCELPSQGVELPLPTPSGDFLDLTLNTLDEASQPPMFLFDDNNDGCFPSSGCSSSSPSSSLDFDRLLDEIIRAEYSPEEETYVQDSAALFNEQLPQELFQVSPSALSQPPIAPAPPAPDSFDPLPGGSNIIQSQQQPPLRYLPIKGLKRNLFISKSGKDRRRLTVSSNLPLRPIAPKGPNSSKSAPRRTCRVCGQRATGFHYTVETCEGCKSFFRRQISQPARAVCPFGGNCPLGRPWRNRCVPCRLAKCISVGMKACGVRNLLYVGLDRRMSPMENFLVVAEKSELATPEPALFAQPIAVPAPAKPDDAQVTKDLHMRQLVSDVVADLDAFITMETGANASSLRVSPPSPLLNISGWDEEVANCLLLPLE